MSGRSRAVALKLVGHQPLGWRWKCGFARPDSAAQTQFALAPVLSPGAGALLDAQPESGAGTTLMTQAVEQREDRATMQEQDGREVELIEGVARGEYVERTDADGLSLAAIEKMLEGTFERTEILKRIFGFRIFAEGRIQTDAFVASRAQSLDRMRERLLTVAHDPTSTLWDRTMAQRGRTHVMNVTAGRPPGDKPDTADLREFDFIAAETTLARVAALCPRTDVRRPDARLVRSHPRARGARHRARRSPSNRSSLRSGDSGDDPPGDPEPAGRRSAGLRGSRELVRGAI
jgi:hypothetical protein